MLTITRTSLALLLAVSLTGAAGCATTPQVTPPATPVATTAAYSPASAPEPIYGNTGAYMCPFTEDGTVAPWVEKGLTAKVAGNLGSTAGTYAGQKALEQVPFIGGWLGSKAGKKLGTEAAIMAAGGWDYIKSTSDLSFDSMSDMALYIAVNHATHPQYIDVLEASYGIYPDLRDAILVASSGR